MRESADCLLDLIKSADELTYGAGAFAGRFEPDERRSGVEAAEYLTDIPADRSNRAAEIAGISRAQGSHLATLQSFVSFESVVVAYYLNDGFTNWRVHSAQAEELCS